MDDIRPSLKSPWTDRPLRSCLQLTLYVQNKGIKNTRAPQINICKDVMAAQVMKCLHCAQWTVTNLRRMQKRLYTVKWFESYCWLEADKLWKPWQSEAGCLQCPVCSAFVHHHVKRAPKSLLWQHWDRPALLSWLDAPGPISRTGHSFQISPPVHL